MLVIQIGVGGVWVGLIEALSARFVVTGRSKVHDAQRELCLRRIEGCGRRRCREEEWDGQGAGTHAGGSIAEMQLLHLQRLD